MARQTIGIGAAANDGTGDPLRTAFDKVNDNFTELYFSDEISGNVAAVANVITLPVGSASVALSKKAEYILTTVLSNTEGPTVVISDSGDGSEIKLLVHVTIDSSTLLLPDGVYVFASDSGGVQHVNVGGTGIEFVYSDQSMPVGQSAYYLLTFKKMNSIWFLTVSGVFARITI